MLDLANINAPTFMDLLPRGSALKLEKSASLIRYGNGQMIHSRGDAKPGISIIKTGAAYAGVYDVNGTYLMASILGPGHTFGEFTIFAELPRTHDMTAAGNAEIYQIPAAQFLTLYEQDPHISRALLSASLYRSHLLLEMMDAIRRLPIAERTAKILLIMMRSTGNLRVFKGRQSDLALTLGISRMSLSTALKQLSHRGLIKTGYGEIIVPNFKKLAQWVASPNGSASAI